MRSLIFLPAVVLLVTFTWAEAAPVVLPSYTAETLKTAVLAGPTCAYLKNAHFKEYMYTTSSVVDSTKRVRVFTWMNKADGPASNWKNTWGEKYDNQGLWLIEKHIACMDCYTIKSLYDKELRHQFLFSVGNNDAEFRLMRPRRPVHAYRVDHSFPESEGENIWKVENSVSDDSQNHLRIQSKTIGKSSGEFLYTVGDGETFDADRRSVFTWASKQDSEAFTEQGDWILEKTACPKTADFNIL